MTGDTLENFGFAYQNARLRPAEQLISRETHDIGSGGQAFLWHRLVSQAVTFAGEQAATAEVIHEQQVMLVRQFCQHLQRRGFSETQDMKVAWMHAEQQCCALT